ncbi:SDR family NAD(P)-dependent oxidoreductase [Draconibacterium mangrovi]|uniref:SDR family NAD(P)-dependent oxidoreductase n=1 Tax=Draconibacterium mangrovi TaxID=2697469 RepID=UPI0013D0F3A4|nr:SDR family oxidoreductase [Draconibacterium mangrovi]
MAVQIDLTGKTAIVTGGTRGIGKSIADKLLEAGAKVICTGTKLKEITHLNEESTNPNLSYIQLDLSSTSSVDQFCAFISGMDKIDILVNNAGINIISEVLETNIMDYQKLQKINLEGPFRLSQAAAQKMTKNNYGRIVNIASIWSVVTRPGRSVYASTKMGLLGLTKTMSVEWAKHNVLVNAVSPGFTLTELTYTTNTKEDLERISNLIPQNRMAQPEEMANGVLFLVSDLNSYISGQNLVIDGGYTDV